MKRISKMTTGQLIALLMIVQLGVAPLTVNAQTDEPVFTAVEEMPEYPGGLEALMNYVKSNLKYPPEAKQNKTEGIVYVSFIVEKDGTVSNVDTIKGVAEVLNAEAERIVKTFPKWTPGKNAGEAVRVKFVMPVKFKA